MGLAGRKVKQRIPADPRNLSWADDASRFGQAYLSKFGWDASRGVGLGASGEGMTSHLKVSQKLDFLGIGADHQRDPHGIAWKQNKDFEALLKRLNEEKKGEAKEDGMAKEGGFVCAKEGREETRTADEVDGEEKKSSEVKGKKRKRKDTHDGVVAEGDSKKKNKKRKHRDESNSEVLEDTGSSEKLGRSGEDKPGDNTEEKHNTPTSSLSETIIPTPKPKIKGRPMAHRARIQAAKCLTNKSVTAISEILGIAPSSTTASSASSTPVDPSPSTTPDAFTPKDAHTSLEKLTTSAKSLADYFKDKLAAKKSPSSSTPPDLSTSFSPQNVDDERDGYDTPRSGLGTSRTDPLPPADMGLEKQQGRQGLGFTSSTRSASTSFPSTSPSTASMVPESTTLDPSGDGSRSEGKHAHDTKGKKKRKKSRERHKDRMVIDGAGADNDLQKQTRPKEVEEVDKVEGDAKVVRDEKVEKKKRKKIRKSR